MLLGGAGLVGSALAISTKAKSAEKLSGTTAPKFSRAQLEGIADLYVKAMLAHDPSIAPFAANAVFAENDQILPLGQASWKTFVRFGRYRHYFADLENGEVGLIANPYEIGGGCVFVLRLKVDDRAKIVEAEQFVARDQAGADAYEKLGAPASVWLEPIPLAQRQSHEALRAVSYMYFQALERNDGAGVYPFRDDCERIEHARPTVGQKRVEGYGHSDATTNFVTLSARAQYQMGLMAFVSAIRDRRTLVVDVERGAVLGSSYYDYDGALRKIQFSGGGDWSLPPYFRTSRSHHANEGFKIINGSFRYVEMTFIEVPFSTKHAFPGPAQTVKLDYDAPLPLPQRVTTQDRVGLDSLTLRLLDAMVRNSPGELPLAPDVRYTENGVAVKIGTGLWQSLDGLRGYRVSLADPSTGQGGWFGTLNERGLQAVIALRYRLAGGLINEIETIIVRPQAPGVGMELATATFTMFTPPLERDYDPAAFVSPDPDFARPSASSAETLATASASLEAGLTGRSATAGAGAVVRENGHSATFPDSLPKEIKSRGHRLLLADTARGLVLDVALRDNDGTRANPPKYMAAPWSDLHARLIKVENGEAVRVEAVVARLPYGQGSGWA
jgi:hypothetical protein